MLHAFLSVMLVFGFASVYATRAVAGEFECLIEPHVTVNVSSATPGLLASVAIERGDWVKKGQVLAQLHSGVERATLELATARADFSKRKGERNADLYEQKLISIHEKDEIETEKIMAKLELREATERLKLRTIRSPINGVIVERHHAAGEFVGDQEVVTIAQINPLNVEVIVPVGMLGDVRPGTRAKVMPNAPVGGEYQAKVVIVDRVVDAASGTIGVRLEMPNPKARLPAGVKCRVRFPDASSPAAPAKIQP